MGSEAGWDEDLVRALVEAAPDALVVFDEGGRIALVNVATESLFGRPRAELEGSRVEALIPGVTSDASRGATGDRGADRVLLAQRRDGAEVAVEVRLRSVRGRGGPLVAATLRDVSERARCDREREAAATRLRTIIDRCPVGIALVLGRNGERVELNEHGKHLVGADIDPEAGLAAHARIARRNGEPLALSDTPAMRAMRGEEVEPEELALAHPDGRRTPIRVHAAALVDARGEVDGAVVTFEDLTAQKQLDRMRSEWTSLVVHDLRQPLNVILLYTRLLQVAEREGDVREACASIASSAERLQRMIHDLLDLSRIEVRDLPLRRRDADLVDLARTVVRRMAQATLDRRIDVDVAGWIPRVSLDPDRVSQVLENLLTNAIKYGTRGTPITVTIAGLSGRVEVAVQNHGSGIAKEDIPRLFQRFRRTDEARRGNVEGIGLGLYIARGLIEAHGGTIAADSSPGSTTTFRFTLPVR
jgi:PAS domain S-box-containing protein